MCITSAQLSQIHPLHLQGDFSFVDCSLYQWQDAIQCEANGERQQRQDAAALTYPHPNLPARAL